MPSTKRVGARSARPPSSARVQGGRMVSKPRLTTTTPTASTNSSSQSQKNQQLRLLTDEEKQDQMTLLDQYDIPTTYFHPRVDVSLWWPPPAGGSELQQLMLVFHGCVSQEQILDAWKCANFDMCRCSGLVGDLLTARDNQLEDDAANAISNSHSEYGQDDPALKELQPLKGGEFRIPATSMVFMEDQTKVLMGSLNAPTFAGHAVSAPTIMSSKDKFPLTPTPSPTLASAATTTIKPFIAKQISNSHESLEEEEIILHPSISLASASTIRFRDFSAASAASTSTTTTSTRTSTQFARSPSHLSDSEEAYDEWKLTKNGISGSELAAEQKQEQAIILALQARFMEDDAEMARRVHEEELNAAEHARAQEEEDARLAMQLSALFGSDGVLLQGNTNPQADSDAELARKLQQEFEEEIAREREGKAQEKKLNGLEEDKESAVVIASLLQEERTQREAVEQRKIREQEDAEFARRLMETENPPNSQPASRDVLHYSHEARAVREVVTSASWSDVYGALARCNQDVNKAVDILLAAQPSPSISLSFHNTTTNTDTTTNPNTSIPSLNRSISSQQFPSLFEAKLSNFSAIRPAISASAQQTTTTTKTTTTESPPSSSPTSPQTSTSKSFTQPSSATKKSNTSTDEGWNAGMTLAQRTALRQLVEKFPSIPRFAVEDAIKQSPPDGDVNTAANMLFRLYPDYRSTLYKSQLRVKGSVSATDANNDGDEENLSHRKHVSVYDIMRAGHAHGGGGTWIEREDQGDEEEYRNPHHSSEELQSEIYTYRDLMMAIDTYGITSGVQQGISHTDSLMNTDITFSAWQSKREELNAKYRDLSTRIGKANYGGDMHKTEELSKERLKLREEIKYLDKESGDSMFVEKNPKLIARYLESKSSRSVPTNEVLEVDFHGLTVMQANSRLIALVELAYHRGWTALKLICGRGNHSQTPGGTLTNSMERILRKLMQIANAKVQSVRYIEERGLFVVQIKSRLNVF